MAEQRTYYPKSIRRHGPCIYCSRVWVVDQWTHIEPFARYQVCVPCGVKKYLETEQEPKVRVLH